MSETYGCGGNGEPCQPPFCPHCITPRREKRSAPNGWPDPAHPGVPLNPERDGWHWFVRGNFYSLALWHRGHFTFQDTTAWPEEFSQLDMAYVGQCLTPAEVEARVADARRDALEEAARVAENEPEPEGDPPPELHGRSVKNIAIASVRATKRSIAAAIRALKGEGHD